MELTKLRTALEHAKAKRDHQNHLLDNVLSDAGDCMGARNELSKWHAEVLRLEAEISQRVRDTLPKHIAEIAGSKS